MKATLFSLFILVSMTVLGQTCMFKTSVNLSDGDSCIMSSYPDENPIQEKEVILYSKYLSSILDSPILKAMGISKFKADVENAIINNILGCYNDPRQNPVVYSCRIFYNEEFNKFLHKLLSSPKVREVCFSFFSNIVCDACSMYPKDFKDEVLKMLRKSKLFIEEMPKHEYELVDLQRWMGEKTLYVDGKEDETLAMGLGGFLIRRIYIDNIPITELSRYINSLIDAVSAIDVSDNADYLCCIELNNSLQYRISATSNYFYATKSGKRVDTYPKNLADSRRYRTKVKCSGNTGDYYYTLTNIDGWGNSWWPIRWDPYKGNIIIDGNGVIIFKE